MLPSPLGRRRGPKVMRVFAHRTHGGRNLETANQYFQITVNVLEAKKLTWSNPQNANSYVLLILDKTQYRSSVKKRMLEPFYGELFVFEMFVNIREVLRSTVCLAVMENNNYIPSRLIGEANVDLGAIWEQPNHRVLQKWFQLTETSSAGPAGFIKLDISIIHRGEVYDSSSALRSCPSMHLLTPRISEQQRASYLVTVYSGYALPNDVQFCFDNRTLMPPSTFVRVSFCGLMASFYQNLKDMKFFTCGPFFGQQLSLDSVFSPGQNCQKCSLNGTHAKTGIQPRSNNPAYNDQICFGEMFPNLSQIILIDVCVPGGLNNKVIATKELRLGEISYDGENGFIPTFGPTLLQMDGCLGGHMHKLDSPYYGGALLISVRTIVPCLRQNLRTTAVEPVTPLQTNNLWNLEEFCIVCPVLEVSMLDLNVTGKICRVAVTIGEISEHNDSAKLSHYTRSLPVSDISLDRSYVKFGDGFPVIQSVVFLPDFRFRMYRNNMILRIILPLDQIVKDVDCRFESFNYDSPEELISELKEAIDAALDKITKFIEIVQKSENGDKPVLNEKCTELDRMQLNVQLEEMETMLQMYYDYSNSRFTNTRRVMKEILTKSKSLVEHLKNIMFLTPRAWPDVVVWILSNGSRVAYCKISAADVVSSDVADQSGVHCGGLQTLLLKPLNCSVHPNSSISGCSCLAAKVEILMWMGASKEKDNFFHCLPEGYEVNFLSGSTNFTVHSKAVIILECRAFIYKGKFYGQQMGSGLHSFVRINSVNVFGETMIQKSKDPVWDEVLTIMSVVNITPERLKLNPPQVLIEVFATEKDNKVNQYLLGRFQVKPEVHTNKEYDSAPPLKWYDVKNETEVKGQIMMSLHIIQGSAESQIMSKYGNHTFGSENLNVFHTQQTVPVTPIPIHLKPKFPETKIDIYWWGLRNLSFAKKPCAVMEIDELKVKSSLIIVVDNKRNCNFTKSCRTSYSAAVPVEDVMKSTLRVKLCDKSTFGRTVVLGYCVKNPKKYLVSWLPKSKRESLMKPFDSDVFIKLTPMLNVLKKRYESCSREHQNFTCHKRKETSTNILQKSMSNLAKWWRMSTRKDLDEEEHYALLPLVNKTEKNICITLSPHNQIWWMRFYKAQKTPKHVENNHSLVMYESELESQPGFDKFKDWCSTLKFYNGKKIGIPEKDKLIYCGSLKIGIALYSWPPATDTVAVTRSGKGLAKSYFEESPANDPITFIVRVYVVKGMNLGMKYNNNVVNPYLVLTCGRKKIDNRKNYVSMCDDPIFGKAFELHGTLPDDYRLTVSVYDYNAPGQDELIGSTVIDLEDRIYTKHKARVGLAPEYKISGPMQWMDNKRPSHLLEELCRENHMSQPEYPDSSSVVFNGIVYKDEDSSDSDNDPIEKKENICLKLLQNWSSLPVSGYPLVPEHIETRTLYLNPDHQGYPMGKLQMWLDIYCVKNVFDVPPPRDISPPKCEAYQLALTIHRISDLTPINPQYKAISHMHLKAWLGDTRLCKKTDAIECTNDGDLIVDWKIEFDFFYDHAKEEMTLKDDEVTKLAGCVPLPPRLVIQLWDNEILLGEIELEIDKMQSPKKNMESYEQLDNMVSRKKENTINLFVTSEVQGWMPLRLSGRKTSYLTGFLQLSFALHPKQNFVFVTSFSMNPIRDRLSKEFIWSKYWPVLYIMFVACSLIALTLMIEHLPSIRRMVIRLLKKWVCLTMHHPNRTSGSRMTETYQTIVIF